MVRVILAGILAVGASVAANATPVFSESFDSVAGLGALGWLQTNNSSPAGETGWFQGNSGVFASQSGAADSYIAANFLNAGFGGNVDNWLITPLISFDTGEGLQAGQSQLKFKDIVFGTVKSLELAPDQTHVVVTVATTHQAKPLLTDKTIFWVVKPRLFAGNVSGLETLLSGSYIGMLPGEAGGKAERKFVGQEDPPILQANVPGHTFVLKAKKLGSISLGSPRGVASRRIERRDAARTRATSSFIENGFTR